MKGAFALDVLTAGLAFIICVTATILASRKQTYRSVSRASSSKSVRGTSPKGTYAFLIPGALFLAVAYSVASANVALSYNNNKLVPITEAYSLKYPHRTSLIKTATGAEVGLSFAKGITNIFATIMLNGAVWLHSSHVTSNGTGIGEPSFLSIIWNTVILLAMAGTGLASWGEALAVRSSSEGYSTVLDNDTVSRALYITFRCCVIVASVSVSVEAIKRYRQVNASGLPGVSSVQDLADPATELLTCPFRILSDRS